ncbi:hypothetical protein BBJ28_00019149 [Nothophytophthora sp. Chile5]|nr:hypothetical protein BBJ28_00019149 [Nothophytophthora sp. Chile5]
MGPIVDSVVLYRSVAGPNRTNFHIQQGRASMSGIERYGSSVHTVEGNVAGRRAAKLTQEREKQQKDYEAKREDIQKTNQRGTRIDANFQSHKDDGESEFKVLPDEEQKDLKKKKKKRKVKKMGPLSFDLDGGDDEAENLESAKPKRAKKSMKNPNVETDFLPDKERAKEEARERQRLRVEWEAEQERIKSTSYENVAVTYSYWDGSGHRREVTVPKKTTIGKYLELVKQQLTSEFAELRGVGAENLIYVKEDLIIPHVREDRSVEGEMGVCLST